MTIIEKVEDNTASQPAGNTSHESMLKRRLTTALTANALQFVLMASLESFWKK